MNGAITKIRIELVNTFNQVFDVFTTREDVLYYQPFNEGWMMLEILEHTLLANYFLLRIVNKQIERALATVSKHAMDNKEYSLDESILLRMEKKGSPLWVPKQYIEPSGEMPLLQLKMNLHDQFNECMKVLKNRVAIDAIKNTSERGRIDALHYLYFLVQHMQKHLAQIERVKQDFDQCQKGIINNDSCMSGFICLN